MGLLDWFRGLFSTDANRRSDDYARIGAWVKAKYGSRFRDGMSTEQASQQLEFIMRELKATDAFRKSPGRFEAFQMYIDEERYGDLVKIVEPDERKRR